MKEIIEKKDDLDLFLPGQYVAPESKDSIVDINKSSVEFVKDLKPLEQMKWAAKKYNIPMNESPKKNCRKCYERGYIGFNVGDKMPIPCPCMFPPKIVDTNNKKEEGVPLSFLPKKAQRKYMRDKKKQLLKDIRKESTLKALRKAKNDFLNSLTSGADNSSEILSGSVEREENNG